MIIRRIGIISISKKNMFTLNPFTLILKGNNMEFFKQVVNFGIINFSTIVMRGGTSLCKNFLSRF